MSTPAAGSRSSTPGLIAVLGFALVGGGIICAGAALRRLAGR